MIGIILAAGKGTRLRPLTYAIPKPLLPVGGKPVLEYAIENISSCDEVKQIFVGVSHGRETIENYIQHVEYGLKVETIPTLGWETEGDLKTITNERDMKETIIVAYGDIVSKIDITEMLAFHKKSKKIATVALFAVPEEDIERFGIAKVEGGMVKKFIEKPKRSEAPSNLANAGYYILEKKAYDMLVLERKKVEETLFPKLTELGELAAYVCKPKYWMDIGTIESYRKANRLIEGIIAPNQNGNVK